MGEPISDSPSPWVAAHIQRFRQTGGNPRPGFDDLLLTTRGRRSGQLRRTALVYVRDGGRYVVAASAAGADRHPAWYLNLVADPLVTVQVLREELAARARTAEGRERSRLWELFTTRMPSYRDYELATSRQIPVVILEPVV